MDYNLTRPCGNCPFRNDGQGVMLRPARVRQIQATLERGEFPCHKTLDYETEDGEPQEKPHTSHCAGALILMEKLDRPSQMMRICERIGVYDRTHLDMEAPVFDSWAEMVRFNQRQGL